MRRPDVKAPLTALRVTESHSAVGILGGGEAVPRLLHLTERKIENVARGVCIESVVGNLVTLGVNDSQLCLVVEHLLEMRNEPGRSCRITAKTSAGLVFDATAFHCPTRIKILLPPHPPP